MLDKVLMCYARHRRALIFLSVTLLFAVFYFSTRENVEYDPELYDPAMWDDLNHRKTGSDFQLGVLEPSSLDDLVDTEYEVLRQAAKIQAASPPHRHSAPLLTVPSAATLEENIEEEEDDNTDEKDEEIWEDQKLKEDEVQDEKEIWEEEMEQDPMTEEIIEEMVDEDSFHFLVTTKNTSSFTSSDWKLFSGYKEAQYGERRSRVEEQCLEHNLTSRTLPNSLVVDSRDGVAYCQIAKVASSTFCQHFINLGN